MPDTKYVIRKLVQTSFLVGYVEERPWWPIQSPNKGRRKQRAKLRERDQIKFIDFRSENHYLYALSNNINEAGFRKFNWLSSLSINTLLILFYKLPSITADFHGTNCPKL